MRHPVSVILMAALVGGLFTLAAPAHARKAGDLDVSPLETRILGQRNWLRGGPAALRIIVSNHNSNKPLRARVTLSLARVENGKPQEPGTALFTGQTDPLGTLDAQFTAPAGDPGAYQLSVVVHSALGDDTVSEPIQLQESMQLLLTADKPLYQPGQTMHMRALALDMATRKALSEEPITFEVEDGRGNKVFKKKGTLSGFGLASADFVLADEVNMGTYTLRAIVPQGQAEKKVRVERYVLPKFKLAVTTEKPFYMPGETVKATVSAHYFFGKPVADGQVDIDVNTVDIGVTKLTELHGKTDANGDYKCEYTLPKSFVGQPLEQGKATVEFAVTLKDTAEHRQQAHSQVPVVQDPVDVVLVPESKALVPGVPNRVFIAAASPDGAPLKNAAVSVTSGPNAVPTRLVTDDLGLATYTFTPDKQPVALKVTVTDMMARQGVVTRTLQPSGSPEGVILRTDKTFAKASERLNLSCLCTSKTGTLYLDVIRNNQTILTRAEPINDGQAHVALPLTPEMVGTLVLHAYKILPTEEIIRDSRTIVVSAADDLDIKVSADKGMYRPGEEALVNLSVTDKERHPVLAALGITVVDESVFALSELQPGLEKIYFTLEKELMEPKYEIHGLKPTFLLEQQQLPHPMLRDQARQLAGEVLLAAAPDQGDFDIRVNTYQQRWAKVQAKAVELMMAASRKIMNAVQKYRQDTGTSLTADESLMRLVDKGYLQEADLLDPWGHFYKTNLYNNKTYDNFFALSSAGPDGKWSTVDDVADVSMYGWNRSLGVRRRFMAFGGRAGAAVDDFAFEDRDGVLEEKAAGVMNMPAGAAGGGFGGFDGAEQQNALGVNGAVMRLATRAPMPAARPASGGGGGSAAPRVREYFPETLFWDPALLTDEKGQVQLHLPLADSITTWRMSLMANSQAGQLGSSDAPIKVFQDFFVDLDLPVSLTQNDHIALPVAVYNYLPTPQQVTLTLKQEPWFKLDGSPTRTLSLTPGQVTSVSFPIVASALGNHQLQVTAKGSKLSDAIRRNVQVTPDGKMVEAVINDRLEGKASQSLTFPQQALPGASRLFVKLYPGTFSQVVEGLDGILRMPSGCFEQTSSSTYPDLLVVDYLKQNKKLNPELSMKAEDYINIGYQRLVTFECKSGGFSWFGNEPAHQVLTAYGLLEFTDMSKVHEVDPALISRTQQWLAGKQNPDGSWEEKGGGIAEGIINRQTGALRTTAYVAWALAESGYQGPALAKGVDYVKAHKDEAKDPYTLAVILNLLVKLEKDSDTTASVANALIALAKTSDKAASWQSDTKTFTGATEQSADLETTGLAAYGLSQWGRNAGFLTKVLTYLVQSKDSFGTWSSTQGTVWSMKALLFAGKNGTAGAGVVTVLANGVKAATIKITPDDSDVMRQVDLAENLKAGENHLELSYAGEGSLLYQVVGRYYLPWSQQPVGVPAFSPLRLDVAYDKTHLSQDDTAQVTVSVTNTTDRIAEMPLLDIGVPPGFTVISEALDKAVTDKSISKYTVAARQVIVYLEKLDAGQTLVLHYGVKAKYPLKAKTPLSKAYPYYNPEKLALSAPQEIEVDK